MRTYSSKDFEEEIKRVKQQSSFKKIMMSTVYTLLVVAAIAVLVALLFLPVLRIYGTSMTPTLNEGDYVVSLKSKKFETGDVIAFYYNNKVLVKRVIANSGDWVNLDDNGNVYVNNVLIDEPYVQEKAFGECDIALPYQVPENRVFVMGDYRATSIDSRNTAVGCVAGDQLVGKVLFTVWPLSNFGKVK